MSGTIEGYASDNDADDSSSDVFPLLVDASPINPPSTTHLLRQFREQWRNELSDATDANAATTRDPSHSICGGSPVVQLTDEQRATTLFTEGTELERLGKVFEAMHLYRRAVQLVPDIEQRIYDSTHQELNEETRLNSKHEELKANATTLVAVDRNDLDSSESADEDDDTNLATVDLIHRFHNAIQRSGGPLFQRAAQRAGTVVASGSDLYISQLPMELLLYILRWVVSVDLDMRSLDQCALVSKGFYLCARDQEIWRLACLRIWGVQLGALRASPYGTWRHMYIERHRIHFNGCYISKTSYMRYGENSFQDQFYRPIHLVEYYRYVRFFTNGQVLMLTTSDDPGQTVNKLKDVTPAHRNDMLRGHYRLHNDLVIVVMTRSAKAVQPQALRFRRNVDQEAAAVPKKCQTFCMEFTIANAGRRRFNQLRWKNYYVINKKTASEETTSEFELQPSMYPTLAFSRVKSYHSYSEQPLD